MRDDLAKEAVILVMNHFKNVDKTLLWFETPNPSLGNMAPSYIIAVGQSSKLLKFIQNALDENSKQKL